MGVQRLDDEKIRQAEEEERRAAQESEAEQCRKQQQELEEQQRSEKAEQERIQQARVDRWLQDNGFTGVNNPKRSMMKSTYALHVAVTKGDAELVGLLIRCGADRTMKNSAKQTPLELAQKSNKKGQLDEVIAAL